MMHFSRRQKRLLSVALIIIIILGVILAAYMMFFRKTSDTWRVQRLGGEEIVDHKASQFKKSSMYIYSYGAFEIELIRTVNGVDTLMFSGIGTYTKTKSGYTFTYIDCYFLVGTELAQREGFMGETNARTYTIDKNKRMRFDFQGILYYFGN